MTNQLAVVIATKPAPHPEHVPVEQERELLDHFNCTLMNNGNGPRLVFEPDEFPDSKNIAPIFGFAESWPKAQETWEWLRNNMYLPRHYEVEQGNWYYYNCGGTIDGEQWNGLDEPGTRGAETITNYEQARAELRCVKAFLPGLKRVVTHAWPTAYEPLQWLSNFEVGAWRLSLMEAHMAEYADRLAQIPELWAYLINQDFYNSGATNIYDYQMEQRVIWASTIGPRVRAVGATCLLINDVSLLKYLFDYDAGRLTAVGKALLEGCRDA